MPGRAIASFFSDNFERRTNQRLRAVAGDPMLAKLITLHKARPHLLLDATPQRTPWLTPTKFNETGGVVVWRASDTSGTPPPELLQRFPGLVPEVPRAFEWLVTGRQPLLRIGWAIVRPKGRDEPPSFEARRRRRAPQDDGGFACSSALAIARRSSHAIFL